MRYWVYQDSQILGPLEPDEMARMEALGPGTLVCQEEASGVMNSDWRSLGDIPDLAELGRSVFLVGSLPEQEPPGPWLVDEGARFSASRDPGPAEAAGPSQWWDSFASGTRSKHLEVAQAEDKARGFESTVAKLHARIEELEFQQGELLRQLMEKGPQASPSPKVFQVRAAPELKAVEPAVLLMPEVFSERFQAPQAAPETTPVAIDLPAPPAPEAPAPVVEEPPKTKPLFKASAPKAWPSSAKPVEPETKAPPVSKFGAPKAFPKAGEGGAKNAFPVASAPKAPGGLHLPSAARHKPAAAPPSEEGPQIPSLAPRMAAPDMAPPPSPFAPPEPLPPTDPGPVPRASIPQAPPASDPPLPLPLPLPPLTGPKPKAAAAPLPASSPPSSPFAFMPAPTPPTEQPPAPANVPAPAPGPAAAPPMTMSFSTPSIPAAQPIPIPMAATAPPSADIAVHTQEVLSRLAKPRDTTSTTAPKAKKRQSKFALIISLSFVGLIVLAVLFFRNTKEIKMMFNMGAAQRPMGAETDDVVQAKPRLLTPSPQAPAPKPESVPDPSPAAIELVKQYPLDGGRGTVGQWLQYSFAASPGDAAKEKWNAGAVSATTYLVQYTVAGAGINYLFEADVAAKTVKGNNPAAASLLSPQTPAAPKAGKKLKPARKKSAKVPAAKKAMPQLPLPSDTDLAPPADDGSQFSTDTVN